MKLLLKPLDRFASADRRFTQFTQKFAEFVEALDYFKEQRCPVSGIVITKTDDPLVFQAAYRTVSVSVRMLCELSESSVATARVVCILEKPSFQIEKKLVGSFTYDGQGMANVETSDGNDPIDVQYMAPEIILNFLHLALQQSAA